MGNGISNGVIEMTIPFYDFSEWTLIDFFLMMSIMVIFIFIFVVAIWSIIVGFPYLYAFAGIGD